MKDDKIYIQHILDCIDKINLYCKNKRKKDFLKDDMLKDAVIRNIEIIGEASKKISIEFKTIYNVVPWKDISGMRDKIVHNYIGIDYVIVWEVIKKDLPLLKNVLTKSLCNIMYDKSKSDK